MASYDENVKDLQKLLALNSNGLEEDSSYYDASIRLKTIGVATPPEMSALVAQIGWPRMYLDSLEERLDIEGFRMAGQPKADDRLWEWWQANALDEESGLGHLEAFIHGRSYVTVAAPEEGDATSDPDVPIIRVESPKNMIADVDPRTRKVNRALRLYKSAGAAEYNSATLYLPGETVLLSRRVNQYGVWTVDEQIQHGLGVVPVVPLLNRERLSDRLGKSEIVPELRSCTDAAARTMMNLQAAAELMAVPQRLLFGVAKEALAADPDDAAAVLEAYYGRIMAIEDPDAHAFQWSAADLRNFVEALQELAKQAASYTGLPPQYLSFQSDNPSSAEAIKSSESRLVKKCERKARMFGGSWEQVMRVALLVMDGAIPAHAHRMETLWRDPSTPTYAAKADATRKLVGTQPIIPVERARIDMGYSEEERKQMKKWDREQPIGLLDQIYGPSPGADPDNAGDIAA